MSSDSEGVVVQAGQTENQVPLAVPEGAGLPQEPAVLDAASEASSTVEPQDTIEYDEDIDADVPPEEEGDIIDEPIHIPRLSGYGVRTKGRRLVKPVEGNTRGSTTPEQKLLILDTWWAARQ
jgi:hypothetical protein